MLERVGMVPENGPIEKRRRVDEPGERLDAPSLHERELELPLVREPRSPQHPLVRIPVDDLLPSLRHAVMGADGVSPPFERVVQDLLPPPIATPSACARLTSSATVSSSGGVVATASVATARFLNSSFTGVHSTLDSYTVEITVPDRLPGRARSQVDMMTGPTLVDPLSSRWVRSRRSRAA